MKVRKVLAAALVGGVALIVPASSAFADGGLLGSTGGVLNSGPIIGNNGCGEDELVSVGGEGGLVGVNLAGDLDTDHGVIGLMSGPEDDLVSVGGDSGLVAVGGKHLDVNDVLEDSFEYGLLNIATACDN